MNFMFASVLVLASIVVQVNRVSGADPVNTNTPAYYPWSETSAFVRVPKRFLDEVNILSATITNDDTAEYCLTDDFIQIFVLKPPQVDQLTKTINKAIDEWRTEKAKQLVPTDEPVGIRTGTKKLIEKVTFRWEPFQEPMPTILQKLKERVLTILGKDRAEWFWQYGGVLDGNERQGLGPKSPVPEGMTAKRFYTFVLQEAPGGPEISLYDNTVTTGKGHSGEGSGAGPYQPALDKYAPESMKPVLARWRKLVSDHQDLIQPANTQKAETPSVEALLSKGPAQERTWQDGAPYVDLPKRLITSFRVAGLTVDDGISPEARALFGVTDSEAKAVTELYAEMRQRFEQLEVSHLERTKPTEYSFVLRAFPDQAKALQAEWMHKLGQIIGTNRADLLDGSIRTPNQFHFTKPGRQNHNDFIRMREKGPSWLIRGTAKTRIDLTVDKGEDGKPIIEHIEWNTEGGENGGTGVQPGTGGMKKMPDRWRHLITPDILSMPPVF